jgi:inward rectifier potassium channel
MAEGAFPDIRRVGLERSFGRDLYHFLLKAPWWRLLAMLFTSYIAANALFAVGFMIEPDSIENARPGSFYDAFFFSVQTMATIGYGKLSPHTTWAHILVTVEALVGLLGFAMATGLIFAKFSRPTARVLFSKVAVMASRDGVPSLVFRMANQRTNQVVEAQLSLSMLKSERTAEGEQVRRIHDLKLQRNRTAIFALSWTAVHPITPDSPLHGATAEQLVEWEAMFIASFTGLDDTFAQTVHARYVYDAQSIVWGGRFVDLFVTTATGERLIDYSHLHDVQPS